MDGTLGGMGDCLPDLGDEHSIGLPIRPYEEISGTDIDETDLFVEGDCAKISLPNTQPQMLSSELASGLMHSGQEQLRDATPMQRPIDVEPVKFDGARPGNTWRMSLAPDLRKRNEVFGVVRQQSGDSVVRELLCLLWNPVRRREMGLHIFGPIIRTEGVSKRPCRKSGECG